MFVMKVKLFIYVPYRDTEKHLQVGLGLTEKGTDGSVLEETLKKVSSRDGSDNVPLSFFIPSRHTALFQILVK